jgi:hypothetical protein
MELVDDDVVELVGVKPRPSPGEGLHAGEDDPRVWILLLTDVEAKISVRLHAAKHITALAQNLLAMGDEQHPAKLRTRGIERSQPGLAKTGRHHDQPGAVSVGPRLL